MKNIQRIVMLSLAMTFLFIGNLVVSAQNSDAMSSKDKMSKDKMSAAMMSDADTEFAKMAAMGGNAEIEWAKVAMNKSTNKDVKKYASKMMKDHMKAGKNLMKVAMKNNMTLPTGMNEEQTQVLNQLQQASATDFDRMYIQMSGVDAHQKMEALFQGEVSGGSNSDLKAFASKTLPTVQMHLKMAQDMANGGMKMGDNMKKDSME